MREEMFEIGTKHPQTSSINSGLEHENRPHVPSGLEHENRPHVPIIKKATAEDIPAILEITLEAFAKYAQDLGVPNMVSALKDTPALIEQDMKKKTVLVAFVDSQPVGTIRYEMLTDKTAYISRFGVRPTTHNCGVGKALVRAAEECAIGEGAQMLALHTGSKMSALVRLYYGMGFYIHSTTDSRGYIRALLCKGLMQGGNIDINIISGL